MPTPHPRHKTQTPLPPPSVQDYSTIYSNPRDPFPLNPRPGTFNCIGGGFNISASSNGQCNVLSGVYTNLFGVYITVDRFWRYHLLNRQGFGRESGLVWCERFQLGRGAFICSADASLHAVCITAPTG